MSSATAQKLARIVLRCPTCNAPLTGHEFIEVATTICAKEKVARLTAFFELVKNRKWADLREFQEFRGGCDNAVVYAIACSSSKGGAVLVLKDMFELYAPDELLLMESTTHDDVSVLKTLVRPDDWQTIGV
jgi:hypothetical protein